MEYEFVKKYLEPKKTGNVILDLNPMSKLNLMFVFGLLPFLIQNYWFGFGMVLFFMAVAKLAGKFQTFFKLYWKCCYCLECFFFL